MDVGYIYIVASDEQDAFKVGYSAYPEEDRVQKMQTGNPAPLRLVGWLLGDRNAEGHLHRLLDRYCIRLEWFRGARLADFLFDQLEEGSLDANDDMMPLTPELIDEHAIIALCAYSAPDVEAITEADIAAFRRSY